jgi:molybdopterin/thiamine biosynthesis adenylyltransferase
VKPRFFDHKNPQDQLDLIALRSNPRTRVYDTILSQLGELVESRAPAGKFARQDLEKESLRIAGPDGISAFGCWIYLPWTDAIVHVLPEDAFRELRTDRNRNKITREEQATLAKSTIVIIGLSVGLAVATTFALEGIGGSYRLADFDTLGLSNLNRLLGSVCELGVNKAELAARRIFELNPYAKVDVFVDGVDETNLLQTLSGADLIVEECDDLSTKIRVRELARQLRLPVLMETSDRGMLDVERFDLDPNLPILHGLLGSLTSTETRSMTRDSRIDLVRAFLGSNMSAQMAAALNAVGRSQRTWPQLGSAVTLGGATVAHAARRLLLGERLESGRYYVDLDFLLQSQTSRLPVVGGLGA